MLALRTSTSLSALALVIGVAGTSWLTALTYERAPMTRRLAEVTLPTAAPALVSKTVSRLAPSPAVDAKAPARAPMRAVPRAPRPVVAATPAPEPLVPVYMPSPRYPMSALRARREGKVVLSVTVTPGGDVTSVTVGRSSGDDDLDRAAREAVREWRFAAADDRPQRYTADLPVNFELTQRY
ncbi:protein TonB [Luteibacter sp. UNCMF331Sha3.1]|uniref:energy transducer TonB n=1 Tax=Luteibacter sp. UNCMF331Sha3.1 TaxID=1502760 RepID=UPI0008B3928E|nr:energy transducer TonB [Luteibacter sp. UNCMF331Sha3.1]SEM59979.1 protein TonB [Luteibacter sp. UNCMF331Sha3.1]